VQRDRAIVRFEGEQRLALGPGAAVLGVAVTGRDGQRAHHRVADQDVVIPVSDVLGRNVEVRAVGTFPEFRLALAGHPLARRQEVDFELDGPCVARGVVRYAAAAARVVQARELPDLEFAAALLAVAEVVIGRAVVAVAEAQHHAANGFRVVDVGHAVLHEPDPADAIHVEHYLVAHDLADADEPGGLEVLPVGEPVGDGLLDFRIAVDDLQHDALAFLVGLVPQARKIARDHEVGGEQWGGCRGGAGQRCQQHYPCEECLVTGHDPSPEG
jgi:hypothetical protein